MKRNSSLIAVAAALLSLATETWAGGGIADVEGARAQERAGRGLTRQEIDTVDRYGGNGDLFDRGYGYVGPPPIGIYIGPRYGYGPPPFVEGPYYEGPYDDDYED